jgi:hypothetical protein
MVMTPVRGEQVPGVALAARNTDSRTSKPTNKLLTLPCPGDRGCGTGKVTAEGGGALAAGQGELVDERED